MPAWAKGEPVVEMNGKKHESLDIADGYLRALPPNGTATWFGSLPQRNSYGGPARYARDGCGCWHSSISFLRASSTRTADLWETTIPTMSSHMADRAHTFTAHSPGSKNSYRTKGEPVNIAFRAPLRCLPTRHTQFLLYTRSNFCTAWGSCPRAFGTFS